MALTGEVAEHFARQADACIRLGSPFTAQLCLVLSTTLGETTEIGRRIAGWRGDPRADALALRICGGLHRLVIADADVELAAVYPPNQADGQELQRALRASLVRHDAFLCAAVESPPQTNEIARSAMLLPGFLAIARETGLPLKLAEIGSSAGLNLLFDRFFYHFGQSSWGEVSSPVQLGPQVRASAPPLKGAIEIAGREGCDIAPIDVSRHEDQLRLRSYIWPDQPARLERLDGALALATDVQFLLARADAESFVRAQLDAPLDGTCLVLFHSIMWQYMPQQTRKDIVAALETAGGSARKDAPLAWLRMEPIEVSDPFATLSLTTWPGGDTRHLARCDYHGRWIEWLT